MPFVGDDSVGGLHLPGPRRASLAKIAYYRLTGCRRIPGAAAVAMIRAGRDVPYRTVLLDDCIDGALTETAEARTFLAALEPLPRLVTAAEAFRREALGEGPLIGLHLRQGNGGAILNHAPYWQSPLAAAERLRAAVAAARAELGARTRVFLATDSAAIERLFGATIPGIVSRPKLFRPPGEGELHLWRSASLTREDAVIDMLLLARSEALIRYPPASFFSFYPAVMKPSRRPLPASLDELSRPWRADDPLAPAILF